MQNWIADRNKTVSHNGKRSHKMRVFRTLLISYISVLLLPVVIGIGLYTQIEKIMVEQAKQSNLALLEQAQQVVDHQFDELHLISRFLTSHPRVEMLLNAEQPKSGTERYEFYTLLKDMQRYRNHSRFVSDFYLYFEKSDTVLSTRVRSDPKMFFENVYGYGNWTYEQWKETIYNKPYLNAYLPAENVGKNYNQDRKVVYLQTLPFGERKNPKGTLVMYIDESRILNMLEQIAKSSQGTIYIKDRSGQIIISTEGREALADSGDLLTVSVQSPANGWEYVSIVPQAVVMAKVNTVKATAVGLLVFCLLAGAAMCLFLSYRSYRPVREIIAYILNKNRHPLKEYRNEYEFIKTTVASSMEQQIALEKQLSQHKAVIRSNFLVRLLKGQAQLSEVSEESLAFMGISWREANAAVMLIKLSDASGFVRSNHESEWALIRFVTGKLAEEHSPYTAYSVELDEETIAVLLSVPDDAAAQQLQAWAGEFQKVMEQRFRTKTVIAFSDIHPGLDQWQECYLESIKALDYSVFTAPHSIQLYGEIEWENKAYYNFPIESEVQLMNAVKSGNWDQVKAMIDGLYANHFNVQKVTPVIGRLLFANLASTLFKLLASLNVTYEELFGESRPLNPFQEGKSVEELHQSISSMFEALCRHVKEQRKDAAALMLSQIQQYIRDHYADPMISLVSIADHFQITSQYLSSFFKKHSGTNLTDFLAQVRIEQAKKLMENPSFTISQIASMVGYTNDVGFIRVFKKHEGITPGKYREIQQADLLQNAKNTNVYTNS